MTAIVDELPERFIEIFADIPRCKQCGSPIAIRKSKLPSVKDEHLEIRKDVLGRKREYLTKVEEAFLIECSCSGIWLRTGNFYPYNKDMQHTYY